MRGYETNRVPVFYTSQFSVYVDRPLDRLVEVYPTNVAVQAEQVYDRLKKLFQPYGTEGRGQSSP